MDLLSSISSGSVKKAFLCKMYSMNCFLRIVSYWTNNSLLFKKILSMHLNLGRLRAFSHEKESETEVFKKHEQTNNEMY